MRKTSLGISIALILAAGCKPVPPAPPQQAMTPATARGEGYRSPQQTPSQQVAKPAEKPPEEKPVGPLVVFGIEFGKPIPYQQCPSKKESGLGLMYDYNAKERCWMHEIISVQKPGAPLTKDSDITINFPHGDHPNFDLVDGDIRIELMDGNVEVMRWKSNPNTQAENLKRLTEKFGPPTTQKELVLQNKLGTKFNSSYGIWTRPDGTIFYEGLGETIENGLVSITSKKKLEEIEERKARAKARETPL